VRVVCGQQRQLGSPQDVLGLAQDGVGIAQSRNRGINRRGLGDHAQILRRRVEVVILGFAEPLHRHVGLG